MSVSTQPTREDDVLDVRQASELVGRHPETIRRWIWSGRLPASKRGNRHFVAAADVMAASGEDQGKLTLAEWAEKARGLREEAAERDGPVENVADMIRQDREDRADHILSLIDRARH